MTTTLDLINAIEAGKAEDTAEMFEELMQGKLNAALEKRAQQIGSDMFNEDEYLVHDLSEVNFDELTEETLEEGIGNLKDLPSHVVKAIAKRGGGENSSREIHHAKNVSALRDHIHDALSKGHTAVVHVNGKPVSAVHGTGNSYSREEYNVHSATGTEKEKVHKAATLRQHRMGIHSGHSYETNLHKKGDAVNKVVHASAGSGEKDHFKTNKVEVHSVGGDRARLIKQYDRSRNRPAMQQNYVKTKEGDKHHNIYGGADKKLTSSTPAGSMKDIQHKAAEKLAGKKVPDGESAKSKAKELHDEISKHIEAGDAQKARRASEALASHLHHNGAAGTEEKKAKYAKTLPRLRSHWDKESAKRTLASLRGEKKD